MRGNLLQLIIGWALVSLTLFGCDRQPAITPSGNAVKIGVIAPFSGSDQAKGREGLEGMEIAMGLQPLLENGDRLELIFENDQDDPAIARHLLAKLSIEEDLAAIITFSSSNTVLGLAGVADAHQTPILAALGTHPDVTKDNGYISQLCFNDRFQGTVAALYVRDELLIDSVAVFNNPESVYSSNLADLFIEKFTALGGRITDSIPFNEDTADLTEQILQVVKTNDPALLYLPIKAENVIRVINETQKLDWTPRIMGSDGLLATMVTQHSEELGIVEGVLATDFFHHGMHLTDFGKEIADAHTTPGTTYSVLGAEAYALLVDAMNRCQDPRDKPCLNQAIRSTTNFSGVTGRISIAANGQAQRPLVVNAIEQGRLKFVVQVH